MYDISPTLHPAVPYWPGDTPFHLERNLSISRGDRVDLSSLRMSLHTGAHVDAPSHYMENGRTIDQMDLDIFLGPALLVELQVDGSIREEHVRFLLDDAPKRLLLRCNPDLRDEDFPGDYVTFTPLAAARLGAAGVRLVGVDAPSVDAPGSDDFPAHRAFGLYGVVILENLRLAGVPTGEYELSALPLKLEGAEASPVRAVLKSLS